MGLIKLSDIAGPCIHPGHMPPSHLVLDHGTYRWTCDACGHNITFSVYEPAFRVNVDRSSDAGNSKISSSGTCDL
jgi:hypothetical protein